MTALNKFFKDPDAVLDYGFDFKAATNETTGAKGDWLASGETISSQVVTSDSGLTVDSYSQSDGIVTAWLSGGEDGCSYEVECKIVTSAGRTDVRRITIEVKER